jgi:hypothetical protein
VCTISAIFIGGLFSNLASAQEESSAAETAAARALGVEGLKLAQAGKCEEAIIKLDRAEKLHHSPIILGRLGECHVTLGRLVEGTEMLRKMLREPLPPNPSPAITKAYERAQATLDSAKSRIASVNISVNAPPDAAITLTVDGKSVAAVMIGSDMPLDPGEHTLEVSAPGFIKSATRVMLGPGDKESVNLKLESDPNAAPAAAAASDKSPPDKPTTPEAQDEQRSSASSSPMSDTPVSSGPNRTAAYISLGVGAVGIGLGAVFGLSAMKAKSDLENDCGGTTCPASEEDRLSDAKRSGTLSTIAFGVGAAGLTFGTILFFTAGSTSSSASSGTSSVAIGPGNVRFSTKF